jgi:hypothetical protein
LMQRYVIGELEGPLLRNHNVLAYVLTQS